MRLVAVTSCPTGIAHTYMAAEALAEAAKAAGHVMEVETQGAAGATPLDPAVIAAADAVVFAADVEVRDRDRFAGKPIVVAGVKDGINRPGELVAEAVDRAQAAPAGTAPPVLATKVDREAGLGTQLRGWLMTGVSYMIPFVAAGGILIALAFVIGGPEIATKINGGTFEGVKYGGVDDITKILGEYGIAGVMFKIGDTAFGMLIPVLAGFIAFAMADRVGLVAGFVAGLLAVAVGAGFLGGLVGGLLAGAVVMWLTKIKMPRAFEGIAPIVLIPLVSTFIVGFVMLVVIGKPIASAQSELTSWLNGLDGTNSILLGALLGAMMAFDMGGPVNKVAYTFGLASLASGDLTVMAAVMAAGMTPPLACALATVLRPKLFTDAERKAGETAWLLGASFITEGAIPFAAADPLRVVPSLMAGSATAGALSMAFGATSRAPHGGIWVVGVIGAPGLYVLAIVAGVAVSAASMLALKARRGPVEAEPVAVVVEPAGAPVATRPAAAH